MDVRWSQFGNGWNASMSTSNMNGHRVDELRTVAAASKQRKDIIKQKPQCDRSANKRKLARRPGNQHCESEQKTENDTSAATEPVTGSQQLTNEEP